MTNRNLFIVIDTVARIVDKKTLIIKGWAIDFSNKTVPEISLKSEQIKRNSLINMTYRGDVNCVYKIPVEICCGFTIAIEVENIRAGIIFLEFQGNNSRKKIKFNLNRKFCHPNEIGNPRKTGYLFFQKGYKYLKRNGVKNTLKRLKMHYKKSESKYFEWIKKNENLNRDKIQIDIEQFEFYPKISLIVPVYNVEEKWLVRCIESVKNQFYENWEICLADDFSSKKYIKHLLEKYTNEDTRIKSVFRDHNGHISEASNSALELAEGEFIGLLDNDDELAPNALYEVVKVLNENSNIDFIYSDEDKIDEKQKRSNPYFKSDWAPDSLMSGNYICHFSVFRKELIDRIGGFRKGYEGAQDYDLVLRFTEKTSKIVHIPKILYHWRTLKSSTASTSNSKNYAFEAGKKALEDSIKRRNLKGKVENGPFPGLYNIDYDIFDKALVSIIIPTRDNAEDLKICLKSIFEKTDYSFFEIIIADNGSEKKETFEVFDFFNKKYSKQFKVIRIDIPFNYARINNIAAKEARGKYLLFLNNDTKIITRNWLEKMVSFAQLKHIGAVGAKLYYPDNTIQHAGVVLGMGGAAGHIHYFFPKGDYGYFGKLVSTTNYLAVTGACLMIRSENFEKIGGFSEEFTVAYNDVDLCIKLYELGYYNVWLPDVELYHYESKSRGYEDNPEKKKRFTKEINMLRDRWMKYIQHDPFYNPNLTKQHSDYSINLDD